MAFWDTGDFRLPARDMVQNVGVDGDHLWPCSLQMRIHCTSQVSVSIVNRAEGRINAIFCICATGHPPKWWQLPRRWVTPRLNDHALTNQRPQVLGPLFMLSGNFSNAGAVFMNSLQCRLVRAFLSDM